METTLPAEHGCHMQHIEAVDAAYSLSAMIEARASLYVGHERTTAVADAISAALASLRCFMACVEAREADSARRLVWRDQTLSAKALQRCFRTRRGESTAAVAAMRGIVLDLHLRMFNASMRSR